MTQDEIDAQLDAMQAEFLASGQEGDRPGLITFQTDDWIKITLPRCCTAIWRGIRYRGIRITVSKERQTRTWSLAEAMAAGEDVSHLEDLKSIENAAV